jgi:phosphotransferase system enzyme I (PtsI)
MMSSDASAGGQPMVGNGHEPGPQPPAAASEADNTVGLFLRRVQQNRPKMQTLRGIAVSPGSALGPALVVDPHGLRLTHRVIPPEELPLELERLEHGLDAARREAEAVEADARRRLGPQYADILAAHARMIADPRLLDEARRQIERDHVAAELAVATVLDDYAAKLDRLADPYLAARAADVRDIQQRILRQLTDSRAGSTLEALDEPAVLLAHDLSPSQTAGLQPGWALGFATEAGGAASHTAIVAAALEIPAVVGVGRFLDRARLCRRVIVDGDEGLVILDPDAATIRRYRRASAERTARFAGLARLADLPAETLDGARVGLWGNIEFPDEAVACRQRGADGIGLYRTEFLYLNADRPPTEQEQFDAYAAVVRAMQGRPVTIRTLDLGADKLASYQQSTATPQRNPFLGLRSLRLSLREPELFRTQLRAILRVASLGDVRLMFPLVSTVAEFRKARATLHEVADELATEGVAVRRDLPVGIMVEVPAAALMADQLAKEVDFFSIGTNDLIQYALAVDRTNETVADLYSAADPAVLRLIAMVVAAARARGREVNICGAMGGDPLYTMLLVGMGLRQLSMPPHQLPEVKRVIRGITMAAAEELVVAVMELDTAEAVITLLQKALRQILSEPLPDPSGRSG